MALHFGDMKTIALLLVIVSVIMASGAYIMSSFQETMCVQTEVNNGWNGVSCYANATTVASNITGLGISALYTLAGFLGILATIMVFAIIIGVIMDSFGG